MSWYRDPQLFLQHNGHAFIVYRVTTQGLSVGTILPSNNFTNVENYTFSKHFSLGNNNESDYDVFLSDLKKLPNSPLINSQGLLATYNGISKGTFTLSRQVPNSPFYSLPGVIQPSVSKIAALEKKVSDLETTLKAQEKQISELTSKLKGSCGVGGDQGPWMTGHPVPSNWVSYDDLDVRAFPKDNHLSISKVLGAPEFGEDNTTNVKSNRFCIGVFPIVVVNVAELTPKQDDARFDPEIWSLYRNEGTNYAARKPFESEMLVETHKTR